MAILANNRKALFDYDIIETFEAGIQLIGSEVKSVKDGHIQIKESYAKMTKSGEVYLHNAHISAYPNANNDDYDPYRIRKLLLHRRELYSIAIKMRGQNLTIVPIKVYNTPRGLVKVEIGLAKGKKKYEKRRSIKEKELKREIKSTLTRL